MSNFRKFGTFRTPHGWLTTTGDGEILQRGTKRGEEESGGPTAYATAFGVSAVISGDNLVVDINAGAINSISVPAYTLTFPIGDGYHHILLKCNASPAPASFPTSVEVITSPTILPDSDTVGYIAAAIILVGGSATVTQLVTGGLRAERHKYSTPNTANYYFYRV